MHDYVRYFPTRAADDRLDVIPLLRQAFEQDADRPVISFGGDAWTAGRLKDRVAAIQNWLGEAGLAAGDKVAVMLENGADHVALIYALILAGIVWVPVNTRLKSAGIEYVLAHARPRLFIWDGVHAGDARQACRQAGFGDSYPARSLSAESFARESQPRRGSKPSLSCTAADPGDTLCIIYTSGTTGAPKGVLFSHRMLRIATESVLRVADIQTGDRLFLWEPLCHIGGAQMLLVPFFATASLYAVTRFSVTHFWDQITAGQCTHVHYLGGIMDMLLRAGTRSPAPALRVGWGAGLSRESWSVVKDWMQISLRECYGMTECSSFATLNAEDRPGSIGKPLPWMKVELLDDEGQPVPAGQHGQIVVSSPVDGALLSGYLGNPQATQSALRDGRLFTGDMAYQDAEGFLYFSGRRTDSMRVRGENVSAWEIERVALMNPHVEQVAAVGVESDIGGQEILLYVQWKTGATQAFSDLSSWLGSRLASFQWPRYYAQVSWFDMTPSERIRKHLLSRDLNGTWDRRTPGGQP